MKIKMRASMRRLAALGLAELYKQTKAAAQLDLVGATTGGSDDEV